MRTLIGQGFYRNQLNLSDWCAKCAGKLFLSGVKMNEHGQPPILRAAQYSWSFTIHSFVRTLPAFLVRALIAGATTAAVCSTLNGGAVPLDLLGNILGLAITFSCLAMALRLALAGSFEGFTGLQFGQDEIRLFFAHIIYYALLFFLGMVAIFVVVLLTLPLFAMLAPDMTAIADDPEAFQQMMEEFSRSPRGTFLSVVILLLTSLPLLYLAARLVTFPAATLMRKRIMIFETWSWTKGHVRPVILALLLTLAPLWILMMAGVWVSSAVSGIPITVGSPLAGDVVLNPLSGFVFGFLTSVFSIPFTLAGAGLSAFMYKGFDPEA